MRLLFLFLLIVAVTCDVQTLTKEFFSNYFTDTDTLNWGVFGAGAPASHQQYSCAGTRLFGGTLIPTS